MADNINSFNDCDDKKCSPLPIDEARLKEMKAMEEAEQRLIEDLFSITTNNSVKVKAVPVKNPKQQVKSLNEDGKLKN
jgi:hypothetical protein